MLKEIIFNLFLINYVRGQCLPLEWDTPHRLFTIQEFGDLLSLPDLYSEGVLVTKNGVEYIPCQNTEAPVFISLDPITDTIYFSSNHEESDVSRNIEVYNPNTCILTITETLLIDLPDDPYNGMFFGCDGFPQTTFIDVEYLSEPEISLFDSSIPPLPPVLGCGKYLRQVTIQPPFF